ncbi:iron-containing alcohol dehydrogenase [Alkalihalophilus lindianensis]|uniref:Iron-containing alcohol dehydrogenase n=1 Tax=Alkalihalophilus lindianensis TaxID=1630542 RepID=A0ABU3XBG1_9BACI|nr:iron-containing alcohol dehydrogenase [Alkalihalophilus lindianensis]MDV2684648.1 iron-containing alcohol dehydrogenase [Alkalihalophilus lindianensis]
MRAVYYRTCQFALKMISQFLPWRKPVLLEGEDSIRKLPPLIKEREIDHLLIVSDKGITSIGLIDGFLASLENMNVKFVLYDKTVPNPTIENIEEAMNLYKSNHCQGIVAFGGGSSIDCAKGVGARLARPEKDIEQMKGVLKVKKDTPPLFAVPTTSGTGSEATLAAVITNSETHEKYAISDPVLIPDYAVLDPLLTKKLPPSITAATGMDALTHAVEAYIGRGNTEETKKCSKEAVKLIFDNIYEAYSNGENVSARKNMQRASYLAGVAFTRAYVGYVHAIAHTLGGFYSVPHGLANAIILPYILEYYGSSVHKPLAELADTAGIGETTDTNEQKAKNFIEAIKLLNERMSLPRKIDRIIESDIPQMVERALKEANPLYPVPKILYKRDMAHLYHMIRE